MPSLLQLSSELHLIIIDNLNPVDATCLKLTNRYFYTTIKPHLEFGKKERMAQILNDEAKERKYVTCPGCERIRPETKYTDAVYDWTLTSRRRSFRPKMNYFCIECGIKSRLKGYKLGTRIIVQGQQHVLCLKCRRAGLPKVTKAGCSTRSRICAGCDTERERRAGGTGKKGREVIKGKRGGGKGSEVTTANEMEQGG